MRSYFDFVYRNKTRKCTLCGIEFTPIRRYPMGFCSDTCSVAAFKARYKAGYEVTKAKRDGRINAIGKDDKCADCGAPAQCYDHRDYTKPLEVVAVCTPCNIRRGAADRFYEVLPVTPGG